MPTPHRILVQSAITYASAGYQEGNLLIGLAPRGDGLTLCKNQTEQLAASCIHLQLPLQLISLPMPTSTNTHFPLQNQILLIKEQGPVRVNKRATTFKTS